MIRAFFVEFVFPLLLFLVIRSLFKNLIGSFRGSGPKASSRPQQREVQPAGELRKDPVCGTYVSTAVSLHRTVRGEPVYFCSQECSDKYR